MAPLYEEVCEELGVAPDASRLALMREKNAVRLAELEEKISDAGGAGLQMHGAGGQRDMGRGLPAPVP